MVAGRLTARIVLCAIKIFDLLYIFANFAPQFPYEPSEKPPSMAVSCDVHEPLKYERPGFIFWNEPTPRHRGFSSAGVGSSFGQKSLSSEGAGGV